MYENKDKSVFIRGSFPTPNYNFIVALDISIVNLFSWTILTFFFYAFIKSDEDNHQKYN